MCENNYQYWPWLWVGRVDQKCWFFFLSSKSLIRWYYEFWMSGILYQKSLFDPLGRPDNCFYTCLSVRTSVNTFQNVMILNKIQFKTMFATGVPVDLAEWIIDDTYLFPSITSNISEWKRSSLSIDVISKNWENKISTVIIIIHRAAMLWFLSLAKKLMFWLIICQY